MDDDETPVFDVTAVSSTVVDGDVVPVLACSGVLDDGTVDQLRSAALDLLPAVNAAGLVIDLRRVTAADPNGLAGLSAVHRMLQGRPIQVWGATPDLDAAMRECSLAELFEMVEDPNAVAPPVLTTPGSGPHHVVLTEPGSALLTAKACPLDVDGQIVASDDVAVQARVAAANLAAILDAHLVEADALLRTTIYVVGFRTDLIAAWDAISLELAPRRCTRTLVGATVLEHDRQRVEIDAVVPLV